jgi:DNA-binding transcriptional regulator YhcF (GntR family)
MAGRKPDVTDEKIISVISQASDPVLSTNEVAERLPIKSNATQKRLKQLHKEERIEGKQAGRSWIWWAGDSDN